MTDEKKISFDGLGIAPKIIEILDKYKFITPTPIQHRAIPVAIEGKDLMGVAQTGTGKTLAFCIPMIQALARKGGQGLILLPTRELAIQVDETYRKIGSELGVKTAVLIGGAPMGRQVAEIKRKPHVIIATPGRLLDHLNSKTLKLEQVKVLVLDEADRMLDMGFAPQIKRVLEYIPRERQTMLFSATMPTEIVSLARVYMKLPVRVEIAPSGTIAERIEQEVFFVQKGHKNELLKNILSEYSGPILVFSRTKWGANKISKAVREMGHQAIEIHSNRSLSQRRNALEGFKKGRYRVLIATDIAARGIDVKGIELVVNYDLPATAEDYVHRIGRTARAGHAGHAISFATPEQKSDVKKIEKVIRLALRVTPLPASLGFTKKEESGRAPVTIHSDFGRFKGNRRRSHQRHRGRRQ